MMKGSLETRTQDVSYESAKWPWESATQVAHLSDIIRLRAARVVDASREIDVVAAGATCGRSGSLRKAAACAAPVVWLGQISRAAHIGRRPETLVAIMEGKTRW